MSAADQYGRVLFPNSSVPDPWAPESRFAQWRGRTCGPWVVITLGDRHDAYCRDGWTQSGEWWFVCGRCHPDAVDKPGTSEHQMRPTGAEG